MRRRYPWRWIVAVIAGVSVAVIVAAQWSRNRIPVDDGSEASNARGWNVNAGPEAQVLSPEESEIVDIAKAEVYRREKLTQMEVDIVVKKDGKWRVYINGPCEIVNGKKARIVGDDRCIVISAERTVIDYIRGL